MNLPEKRELKTTSSWSKLKVLFEHQCQKSWSEGVRWVQKKNSTLAFALTCDPKNKYPQVYEVVSEDREASDQVIRNLLEEFEEERQSCIQWKAAALRSENQSAKSEAIIQKLQSTAGWCSQKKQQPTATGPPVASGKLHETRGFGRNESLAASTCVHESFGRSISGRRNKHEEKGCGQT